MLVRDTTDRLFGVGAAVSNIQYKCSRYSITNQRKYSVLENYLDKILWGWIGVKQAMKGALTHEMAQIEETLRVHI